MTELEFMDDLPEDRQTEEEALIANIANRLNPEERAKFLDAMEKVRSAAGKGRVRIREPDADERLILDTFERYEYHAQRTADALGIPVGRVHIVTRRWHARPIESKIPALRNPSEHLLRFLRTMWAEGKTMDEMAYAVKEIVPLERVPNHYMMKSLCEKAGIDTTRKKLDIRLYPELIADFEAIAEKYGFTVGTLFSHYNKAKKAERNLPQ